MKDEDGSILSTQLDISNHVVKYYKNLYSKNTCDTEKQAFFLSYLNNELSNSDREILSAPLTTEEIFTNINKSS